MRVCAISVSSVFCAVSNSDRIADIWGIGLVVDECIGMS